MSSTNQYGQTALLLAAEYGHAAVVSTLLIAGADISATSRLGQTALLLAAENGETAVVSALLTAGADVNAADQWGNTALTSAARWGHTDTVSTLLVAGANIEAVSRLRGNTALMNATQGRHNETAFCLLNSMSSQQISATRPAPSFLSRLLRRQPVITPIEASYNQALTELRQGLSNVFGAFNEGANRHNLGTANALLNIITGYYAPNWCGNPNQEMSFALGQRRRPVILSCTSKAMNLLRSTLTSLTNAVTPAALRFTEKPAPEQELRQGQSKKARRD
jgi:hypothetical protein